MSMIVVNGRCAYWRGFRRFTKTCRIGKLGLHGNHNFSITNYGAILKKKKTSIQLIFLLHKNLLCCSMHCFHSSLLSMRASNGYSFLIWNWCSQLLNLCEPVFCYILSASVIFFLFDKLNTLFIYSSLKPDLLCSTVFPV